MKLKIKLPYDPTVPFLGTEENMIQKDTCSTVFIVVLFTKAWAWKQPNHPLRDEWVKKSGTHI